MAWRGRAGLGAAVSGMLAAAVVLGLAVPAGARTASVSAGSVGKGSARAARGIARVVPGLRAAQVLHLRAMPAGTVRFGRTRGGRLMVRADLFGLTPGSSHRVEVVLGSRAGSIRFGVLTAGSGGQAHSTLHSRFTGRWPAGARLVVRMGAHGGGIAAEPIAWTRRLARPGHHPHKLIAVEISRAGVSYGTPRGRATISYSAARQTLTVTVHASGVTPGPHAAHIHLGSCRSQGPVRYMLRDLVADRRGQITRAVRVFTHITAPIPAHGWYLNIHQGNSSNILSNGQPTILFRPLICADITRARSVT